MTYGKSARPKFFSPAFSVEFQHFEENPARTRASNAHARHAL